MESRRVERPAGAQASKLKAEETNDSAITEDSVRSSQDAEVGSTTSSSGAHASQSSRRSLSSTINTPPSSNADEQRQAERQGDPELSDSAINNDESVERRLSTKLPIDNLPTGANHSRRKHSDQLSGTLLNLTHGEARKILTGVATSVCRDDAQPDTPSNALPDAPHANIFAQIQDYRSNFRAHPPLPDSEVLEDSQKPEDKGRGRAVESSEESFHSMRNEDSEFQGRPEQMDGVALPDLRIRIHKKGKSSTDELQSSDESRSLTENQGHPSFPVGYFSIQPHENSTQSPSIEVVQPTTKATDNPEMAITPTNLPPPLGQATSIPNSPSEWRRRWERPVERIWYGSRIPSPTTSSSPTRLTLPGIKLWIEEDTKKWAEYAKPRHSYSKFLRGTPSQSHESTIRLETMPGAARANVFLYLLDRPKDLNITLTEEIITTNDIAENPDDYEIIRALTETVGSSKYWVLNIDNVECHECVKTIKEQRELPVNRRRYIRIKSLVGEHTHCIGSRYHIHCKHEPRMKRFFKGIGEDDAKRMQYIRLESEYINPDSLASAVNILKRNLPDLRGAQIILHSSETRYREIRDEITARRFVCALRELERILPKDARLDVIGSQYHPVLKKMWEDHRRPWWMNNRAKRTACFSN